MSKEGDQQNKKDGGALNGTHESDRIAINCFSGDFKISDSLNNLNENVGKSVKIQDGVIINDDNEISGGLPDSLHFLNDEIDNYDRAVVENNTEWLKARCKGLDSGVFDLNVSSVSDVSLSLSVSEVGMEIGNLPALGLSTVPGMLSVQIAPDKVEQTQPDIENSFGNESVVPLVSDGAFAGDTVYLLQNGSGNQNILQSIPSLPLDSAQNISMDSALSELSSSTDLGIDKEMFLQVNKGLQSNELQGETEIGQQKNVVLISQDDLFSQEGGRIEGLGDSNMRLCVQDGVLSIVSTNPEKTNENSVSVLNNYVEETINNAERTEIKRQVSQYIPDAQPGQGSQIIVVNPVETTTEQQSSEPEKKSLQPDFSVATISISNDKDSKQTKILVDTSQGQRLYQINIADFLNQKAQKQQTSPSTVIAIPYQEVKLNNLASGQTSSSAVNTPDVQETQAQEYFLVGLPGNEEADAQSDDPSAEVSEKANDKAKKLYICEEPGCGKVFKKSFKLSVHKMSHTGERPFKCEVAGCEWAFTTNYRLKRHEEAHKGNKEHVCAICSKQFSTIYNLNSHLKLHERPLTLACEVEGCDEKFATQRQLDAHMKTHENVEKGYKCPHEGCDKTFLSAHCVGSHPRVHQQEQRELRCDFEGCDRVFDKPCRLTQHMRSHTGEKPYVCDYEGCTWAFSTASKLTRHMTKHTGARKWMCIICGKAFRRGEHLKGHMITHSGMKPFSCPVDGCNAKFVAKSSLYVHMKKHDSQNGEKEILYHCPMEGCYLKYNSKASLRQHIIKHFPTKGPNDCLQVDFIPLLNESLNEDGMVPSSQEGSVGSNETVNENVETSWQPVTAEVQVGESVEVGAPLGELVTAEGADPVAFICKTDKSGNVKINITNDQSVASTIVVPDDQSGVKDSTLSETLADPMTTTVKTEFGLEKIQFQPKVSVSRKTANRGRGSARTDYQSNLELSDRAKKRRKLLREKAEGSSINIEESSQDVSESQSELTGVPENFPTDTLSQGITFRDPETGVLYVQTQLLQDDPPHPDLYADENVLKTELSLPVSTELTDQSLPGAEFVGSTINLQDLVG